MVFPGCCFTPEETAALPEQEVWSHHGPSDMQKLPCFLIVSSLKTNAVCYSEAAATAEGVGGWPPPEMAAIDATLQQQWWTAPVLARFEDLLPVLAWHVSFPWSFPSPRYISKAHSAGMSIIHCLCPCPYPQTCADKVSCSLVYISYCAANKAADASILTQLIRRYCAAAIRYEFHQAMC